MNETHQETADLKADHTVRAEDLIREFISNDTSANKKYREKVLIVMAMLRLLICWLIQPVRSNLRTVRGLLPFSLWKKRKWKKAENAESR